MLTWFQAGYLQARAGGYLYADANDFMFCTGGEPEDWYPFKAGWIAALET